MWIGHRKGIRKLTFRALALHRIRSDEGRNVSFLISLLWPIHIINPVDKTKLSYLTLVCCEQAHLISKGGGAATASRGGERGEGVIGKKNGSREEWLVIAACPPLPFPNGEIWKRNLGLPSTLIRHENGAFELKAKEFEKRNVFIFVWKEKKLLTTELFDVVTIIMWIPDWFFLNSNFRMTGYCCVLKILRRGVDGALWLITSKQSRIARKKNAAVSSP